MVNPQNQNPEKLLEDFRESWLSKANIAHFGEVEESEIKVDSLIQTIIVDWLGTNPIFLLEPILRILRENQSQFENQFQFDDQDLKNIKIKVIEFLDNDDNFKKELKSHFSGLDPSPKSLYKNHPILSDFVNEPPPPPPPPPQPLPPLNKYFLPSIVVLLLGLVGVGLWMYFNRLQSIFSLCESDFRYSRANISCGDEELSNVSKLSNQEMETFINKLDADFGFYRTCLAKLTSKMPS